MRGIVLLLLLAASPLLRADGRDGSVHFSDGHELRGALSLTPGKQLRIYINETTPVSVALDEVKEIRLKVEKEEMRRGFYFPNAGQATQAQTNDTYPVRYLQAEIALADGKVLTGHLMTTTLYVESEDATRKVVLMAKMTGEDNQKIEDIVYPTTIQFSGGATSPPGSVEIDLTQAGFTPKKPPVIFEKPDLTLIPSARVAGQPVWTVTAADPSKVLFSVEAADGIHVAWPASEAAPEVQKAVEEGLANMRDFFDTHAVVSSVLEVDDIYTLVVLSRSGATHGFAAGKVPWSLVALRWKYDAETRKVTLLNRTSLAVGRAEDNSPVPAVLKQPELLRDISSKATP